MQIPPVFVSELTKPDPYLEADVIQPSYPSERLDMYQQAPNITQSSFPPRSHMTGPGAPNHSPEALIADMWKTCPALCASIRHDFDLNVVFHPALVALHGETFLRLAASQIAMQNQATEMTHMRNALSRKQKLLEVNAASAKDLQTKFVSQQSELKEIRRLLEQQSQSLTSSDAIDNGQVRQSQTRESDAVSQGVTVSPTTTASTLAGTDGPVHKFYSRSTALPPLKLSIHPDNVDKYDETHGYGHAETQGPSFRFDRAEDGRSGNKTKQLSDQPNPLPPTVLTSTVFEPDTSFANPNASLAAKEQTPIAQNDEDDKGKAGRMPSEHQASAVGKRTPSAGIKIMKREHGDKSGFQDVNKTPGTSKNGTHNEVHGTIPATPLTTTSHDSVHEDRSTVLPSKPASYAAAVRTTPIMTPKTEQPTMKPSSATPESAPAPDLGFTLEPLPKPTIQQVQSQQQQSPAPKSESNSEEAPFDFHEWKKCKIAAGTWVDRTNQSNMPRAHQRSNYPNTPFPTNRPFHPSYRGRGGRFNHHHNENFRPSLMNDEERKRSWLAWKQQCINEGKWHPTHPFREAWKNE